MTDRILLVEDEAPLRTSMVIALRRAGCEVSEAATLGEARAALERELYDLVLTDLRLPDGDGVEVVRLARERDPETEVVVVTAFGTVETAVEVMRLGALDFVQKPFTPQRLVHTVQRALEHRRLLAEVRRLGARAKDLVGDSAPMRELRAQVARAAPSRAVLILGETGTGKELVARAVHAAADAGAPFVVVNCAGLAESLLESELFGHVRGAFTGATHARRGLLAEADGGTLFLDEIGEVPLGLQAKLLRFLQFGEVRPLGSNQVHHVRVRVLAATNRDLPLEVRERRFREDLFYRLDVVRIVVPPLRARLDDLPALAAVLLQGLAAALHRPAPRLHPAAVAHLARHAWPGNVRELENLLERAMLTARGAELGPEDLALEVTPRRAGDELSLAEVERRHILTVLERTSGDRRRAVELLGISRSTLRRKLMEYGLWNPDADDDEG